MTHAYFVVSLAQRVCQDFPGLRTGAKHGSRNTTKPPNALERHVVHPGLVDEVGPVNTLGAVPYG